MELRPLVTNGWIGKVLGTGLGLILAPVSPIYAALVVVLGFAAGYEWDVYASNRLGVSGAVASNRQLLATTADPWAVFLLCGLGRIASAGGAVLPAHVERAEALMRELGFAADRRRRGISWFNAGKRPDCAFSDLAERCSAASDVRQETRVLELFAEQAQETERPEAVQAMRDLLGLLRYRGARLGPDRSDLDAGDAVGAGGRLNSPPRATGVSELERRAAFAFFELPATSGVDEVKLAYRRFVGRCHPDRLPQAATAAERSLAQQRMVEARIAYENLLAALSSKV